MASHDLRAPLRAIHNLAKLLGEDLAERLPPESQEHLELMRQRVLRMDALLDGLLNYSRISRAAFTPELVDTDAVVRGIVEMLGPPPASPSPSGRPCRSWRPATRHCRRCCST